MDQLIFPAPLQYGSAPKRVRGIGAKQSTIVAIPAKDEEERVGACITALARQNRMPDGVLLLLNNCTDRTEAVARELESSLPFALHVVCHAFPAAEANAGNARRLAMQYSAKLAGGNGVLLTTDADTIVPTEWVERSLAAIDLGADVVCGRVRVDPLEAALIPRHLHDDDALECEFLKLLDRLAFTLDPVPADPWPRHTEAAGASLGVTVAAFASVGGIPAIAAGEDRAFVARLARVDARIRHDPGITVTVSGRLHGRAPGGMADTIRRRMQQQDEFTDDTVEPAADAYRRADFRRRVRVAWAQVRAGRALQRELAADLGMSFAMLLRRLNNPFFGAAWAEVEADTPFLVRRRVRFSELLRQIAYARQLLEQRPDTCREILMIETDPCR